MPRARGLIGNATVGGVTELGALAAAFADAPMKTKRAVAAAIRAEAEPLRRQIASNASWSSRIPDAVKVGVSFVDKGRGVRIYVDSNKAPHARPFEGLSAPNGVFRHPVYGRKDREWTWVNQRTRPFFFRAVQARRSGVIDAVERAVLSALPK